MLTKAQVNEIAQQHFLDRGICGNCQDVGDCWPCDAAKLVESHRELSKPVEDAEISSVLGQLQDVRTILFREENAVKLLPAIRLIERLARHSRPVEITPEMVVRARDYLEKKCGTLVAKSYLEGALEAALGDSRHRTPTRDEMAQALLPILMDSYLPDQCAAAIEKLFSAPGEEAKKQ